MITESTMGIGRAARLLGNIVQTLQRWEHNDEAWTCAGCAAHHDCDVNAAVNLQRLATGAHVAHGATRGEPGADARHCRRRWPGGRRESDVCQARVRSAGRLGAGRDR